MDLRFSELVMQLPRGGALYRIRLPFSLIGEGETNCYALFSQGEWLIVDFGARTEDGYRRALRATAELGIDWHACKIFLTHGHFDHMGLLDEVAPLSVETFVSPRLLALHSFPLREETHALFGRRMLAMGCSITEAQTLASIDAEEACFNPCRNFVPVSEGDVLHVGCYAFRVLATPGHTFDHASLFEPSAGMLFSGDSALPDVVASLDAFLGSVDGIAAYAATYDALCGISFAHDLPGHGCMLSRSEFLTRFQRMISLRDGRCLRIVEALRAHPFLCGEALSRKLFAASRRSAHRRQDRLLRYYALLETFCCLQHLAACGVVERVPFDDGVYRYRVS